MSIRKKTFKMSALLAAGVLGISTFALSSCSTLGSNPDNLVVYYNTNVLDSNNSPLNASFTNGTVSTYGKSEMLNLLDYQTTGQFKFSGTSTKSVTDTTTHDFLELSGASALIIFDNETSKNTFDSAEKITNGNQQSILQTIKNISPGSTTVSGLTEGQNYWIFLRSKGAIQLQNGPTVDPENPIGANDVVGKQTSYYGDATSKGTVYQFIVDTDNQWVDSDGNAKGSVSSKDFERAIEAYYLSSELNYNRNGYFLDLLGINAPETLESNPTGDDSSFNILTLNGEDYASTNDAVFTMYLNSPYVYTNDLLSKDYFAALPHENQKVKNITTYDNVPSGTPVVSGSDSSEKTTITYKSNQYPIVYTETISSSGISYSIDESNTNWNEIFGSGGVPNFMQDAWFAGPYYISNFSTSKIIFKLNEKNLNTVGKYLLDYDTAKGYDYLSETERKNIIDKRINTITFVYGSGNADVYYQMFKSDQLSYLNGVPDSSKNEAAQLFGYNGELVPIKTVKTAQSNYITYTPVPYVLNDNNQPVPNSYITSNFAKFDYDWNSKNSTIIRAAIAGLINHYQLSIINLPGSGDFQLSATPFGAFDNYYQAIADGDLYGGLPRPYEDYMNNSGYILDQFSIPYYELTSSGVTETELTISEDTLKSALESYGATTSHPLIFSYKMGEGSISNNYQSYLNSLSQQISTISGGLISFVINQRDGTNPTSTEWYNQQCSPLGFSYWSPDYNGVGTWIEADTTLQDVGGVEGIPATNAHNSFLTFLEALVTVVSLTHPSTMSGANGTTIYDPSSISSASDPFSNDNRIQEAFHPNVNSPLYFGNGGTSWADGLSISDTDPAGIVYSKLAIGLLNELIENGVFNQSVFASYVQNPSKLSTDNKTPTSESDVYLGNDVLNSEQSPNFSKWLGIYAGESADKGLFETVVLDSDYSYIPRSEQGLNDFIYTLVSPQFQARTSSVTPVNYRDFSKK